MADVFVGLLTTFVVICLSYLFWKWVNRRNELLLEERRRAKVPAADVRRNRLKRFDFTTQQPRDESVVKSESENVHLFQEVQRTEERTQNKAIDQSLSAQEPDLADLGLPEKGAKNPNLTSAEQPPNVAEVSSAVKHENSHRWVTVRKSDDVIDDVPVTKPLTSLEELKFWNEGFDEFNMSNTPLMRSSRKLEQRPHTLVCHDMKGGYVEDR